MSSCALPSGSNPAPPLRASQLLYAEERQWYPLLRSLAADGTITEASFMESLQRRMEVVVLGLQSGSYAQRVQVGHDRAEAWGLGAIPRRCSAHRMDEHPSPLTLPFYVGTWKASGTPADTRAVLHRIA